MKKILLVTRPICPPWDEASKNFAYYLAQNVSGHEFHLLTHGKIGGLHANIVQHPIYSSAHLSLGQKANLLKLIPLKKAVAIFHFMLTPNALNTFAFKRFLSGKHLKTIQTIATLREDLYTDGQLKNVLFADHIITYSDHAKHKLASLGFNNVTRIYPGIDLQKYAPEPKDADALSLLGITPEDFVVTYPGEYTRLGATDDIVAALPELFERIPHAKFVFANRVKNEKDAFKKQEVVRTLTEQGILDKVIFTDTFADMPKIYNLSDVVVFPVRDMHGKFDVPLAVIEAFACEKPVVISDIPILAEFAKPDNSVIMQNGNFSQFVDEIVALSTDTGRRSMLGKNARAFTQQHFDIRDVAQKYAAVYDTL